MQASESVEFAWACGLFEGEGTIVVYDSKSSTRGKLALSSTDEDVIRRFAEIVKVGNVTSRGVQGTIAVKPSWIWNCSRRSEMVPFLERMLPLLGARRAAKAREVLALPHVVPNDEVFACGKCGGELTEGTYGKRYCVPCRKEYQRKYYLERIAS